MRGTETTTEIDAVSRPDAEQPAEARSVTSRSRRWRGLSGALAAGLVVLTVVVLVAQVVGLVNGSEGPGPFMVVGHVVAAALAVPAQRSADRRQGGPAALAGAAVAALTLATLWLYWWH
jgi:ferric-dicitrate binding protein FerR (iron transport regulator)